MRKSLGLVLLVVGGCFSEPENPPEVGGSESSSTSSTSGPGEPDSTSTASSSGDTASTNPSSSSSDETGDTVADTTGSTTGGVEQWDPEPLWLTRLDSGIDASGDRVDEVLVAQDGAVWAAGAAARMPSEMFLAHLELDGTLVDVYGYDGVGITNARGLAETSNGFLVGGHGNSIIGGVDRLLVEFDVAETSFEEPYDFGTAQPGLDIVESVVVGGDNLAFVAGVTQDGGSQRAWVERLPSVGPTWTVEEGTALEGSRSTSLHRLGSSDDFDLVVTGALRDEDGGDDTAWVARFGPNGAERWSSLYPSQEGYPTVAHSAVEGISSSLLVVGTVLVPEEGLNAWVQRLSADTGSTGWYESFDGNGADDRALDVAVGLDGDVFACGSSIGATTGADLWVVRLSAEGEARGAFVYDLGMSDDDTITSCVVHEDRLIIGGRGYAPEGVQRDGFVAALPI